MKTIEIDGKSYLIDIEKATEQHICDECRFATYDTNPLNLSIVDGKPTLIICALQPFPKIIAGSIACDKFRLKSNL